MNGRVRLRRTILWIGGAAVWLVANVAAQSSLFAADESCFWGASSERTTYLPPYNRSDAPTIPLLKRPSGAVGNEGSVDGGGKKSGETSVGPRVGDSGTFIGTDGKTYFYRFVEGTRRRTFVETRRVLETPPGATRPIWVERKFVRRVDEPRLIKEIWPAAFAPSSPTPCRSVESVAEAPDASERSGANGAVSSNVFRATARTVVR